MTRPLRRWLALLVVALLTTASLAWSVNSRAEQVNILMPAPFADATAALVREFNRAHQGRIHLQVSSGPRDTETMSDLAISSLLLGDPPYDALLIDVTWLPKYVAAQWLEPLDTSLTADDELTLIRGARLGNAVDGTLYRWPFNADVGLLYWRTDLMDAAPETPDELIAISQQLIETRATKEGFVWQGRQYEGLSCDALEIISRLSAARWLDGAGESCVGIVGSTAGRGLDGTPDQHRCQPQSGDQLLRTGNPPGLQGRRCSTDAQLALRLGGTAEARQCRTGQNRHHHDGGGTGGHPRRHPRKLGSFGAARHTASRGHRRGDPVSDECGGTENAFPRSGLHAHDRDPL